jgi:alkanesulfonate monooxygenase SsuD/methylene tetrahydromethanopterin reductase-like flavin-dependent oxidoreductase (luciferase family)
MKFGLFGGARTEIGEQASDSRIYTDYVGTPEEMIARLKRLEAGGVRYVMVIDVGGSLAHLRTFAREVMPEFAD